MPELLARLTASLADRYRIERELGQGGMARVYLAADLRHHRQVALKVLKPEIAATLGAERFLREIELEAGLTHPHILPLHDSGSAEGFLYYVMPYVEGESLRERLERERQLPLPDALQITCEVADALSYAHGHGLIHRDIKPANILLESGHAVVADFGIARAVSVAGAERLTESGLAVGTPAYMSPEQAAGDSGLDGRCDIYSLGCVLYEMLSGETPYTGPTAQAILAKKLSEPLPRISVVRETVPPAVEAALDTALARTPADRFRTAADFAAALSRHETTGALTPQGAPTRRARVVSWPTRARWAVPAVVVGAAIVALAVYAWVHGGVRPGPSARRSVLALPLTQPVVDAPGLTFALSPDGNSFVYVGRSQSSQELYVRGMEAMEGTVIPGTQGATTPFFSPDGQWVGFMAGGKIRKVPIRGGRVETMSDSGAGRGASWGENGIVFAPSSGSGLMHVPATGGTPVVLTTPDTAHGEIDHRWPQWLPGGDAVLFTSWSGGTQSARAAVVELRSHVIHYLGTGIGARYSSTGHIVFAVPDGRLLARRFDARTFQAAESTTDVLKGVRLDGGPAFAVGPGGMIIYMPDETAERTVDWIDRAGRSTPLLGSRRVYSDPRLSPDGSRLALTIRQEGAADVWVYSFGAGTLSRLTRGAESLYPVWSPDGHSIAFCSNRRRSLDLYAVPSDGSAEPTLLYAGLGDKMPDSWSPDGRTLFFRTTDRTTARDVWALRMSGGRVQVAPVLTTRADERSAMISPDGRWLAFTSDESGADQVYVRAYPGSAAKWQVSADGGTEPQWSKDGRELFYRAGDALMAAAVDTRGRFRVTSRAQLFTGRFMTNPFRTNYDVSRDGRRFVVIRSGEAAAQLVALMNWLPSSAR